MNSRNQSFGGELSAQNQQACCSTRKAAEHLGLSVGTVQRLVDVGVLQAWKTEGGHRRVFMADVLRYEQQQQQAMGSTQGAQSFASDAVASLKPAKRTLAMLVVEDNPIGQNRIRNTVAMLDLPVKVHFVQSNMQALFQLVRVPPDVLILALNLANENDVAVLTHLQQIPHFAAMKLVILQNDRDPVPANPPVLPKACILKQQPLNQEWLAGFLWALLGDRNFKDLVVPSHWTR